MNKLLWVAVVTIGIISVAGISSAEDIKEGEWSLTIVTNMGGMDAQMAEMDEAMANMSESEKEMMEQMMGGMGMKMGAGEGAPAMTVTVTQCVTHENPVPQELEEGCTSTHETTGNKVHFEVACPDGTSTGDVTYNGNTMEGKIVSQQMVDGAPSQVTIDISGIYVGACQET